MSDPHVGGSQPLLADSAVDGFAEEVGVAGMPGRLLYEMKEDPAQGKVLSAG
jgi:hypothetical protein